MVDELLDTPVYQVIWGLVVRRAQGGYDNCGIVGCRNKICLIE